MEAILKSINFCFFLGNVGGRGVLRRNYTGKKPVLIQHRTPDAANYYDHENVSECQLLRMLTKRFEVTSCI